MIGGKKFRPFADFYRSDLLCNKALEADLDLWEAYWLNDTSYYPDDISPTLKCIDFKRIFLPEEVENLHSQYNDIRKIEWNSIYACSKGNFT